MKRIGEEEEKAVLEVMRRDPVCLSGYYRNPRGGPSVQAFEDALAKYVGAKHAVACSNGTSALHLALLALGVGKSNQVIVPPLTFSATATAVLMVGAEPVFADVDPHTWNLDPNAVGEAMTELTKAIIPVDLLGTPCDWVPLLQVSVGSSPHIPILEDAAQALGAKYLGESTGTFGRLSTLSFQETKSMTTLGEGGAILIPDTPLSEGYLKSLLMLRNHGSQYGEYPLVCYNMRMTEAQAAFGLVQLRKVDRFNEIQRENYFALHKALDEAAPGAFTPQMSPVQSVPTRYIYGTTVQEGFPREALVARLTELGVNKGLPGASVGLGYTRTIMDLPLLRPFKRSCPVAEGLVRSFVWFDCLRWRSEEEARAIIGKIVEAVREVA